MKIVWTPQAVADREAIWAYVTEHDPAAASRLDQRFSTAVASLIDFPLRGHPGEVPGTRELTPHRNYRLVYEVVEETVWILVLIHSARLWPPLSSDSN
ncbi:type II toxin-antitoxin system RelE/ParE family toxin [Sphingomonas floccifaciens]|uniref:Type II toxin-antitoxin system RelE/ParE family toxin n=1 Tax=Sphingomonas floccifaciens TaxID=1844115 RepID=A0ABW4NDT9_9SPHN